MSLSYTPYLLRHNRLTSLALGLIFVTCLFPLAMFMRNSTPYYLSLCGLILLFFDTFLRDGLPTKIISLLGLVLVLAAPLFFSCFQAISPERCINQSAATTLNLFLIPIAAFVFIRQGLSPFLIIAGLMTVIVLALNSYLFLNYGTVRAVVAVVRETYGTFSNVGTALIVGCAPLLLARTVIPNMDNRLTYFLLFAVVAAVLLAQSRSGIVLVLAPATILSITLMIRARRVVEIIAVTFILPVFSWFLIDILNLQDQIMRTVERLLGSALISQGTQADFVRLEMFRAFGLILNEKPLFGVGYENFGIFMQGVSQYSVVSHNIFVTAFGEMGIFGLLTYGGLFFWGVKRALGLVMGHQHERDYPVLAALGVAILMVLLHALFRPQLNNPLFFCLIGLAFAVPQGRSRQANTTV